MDRKVRIINTGDAFEGKEGIVESEDDKETIVLVDFKPGRKVRNNFKKENLEELTEAKDNDLKKRARKHKKTDKKGARGWFVNPNGGNVELNIQHFNHVSSGSGESTISAPAGLGEDIEVGDDLSMSDEELRMNALYEYFEKEDMMPKVVDVRLDEEGNYIGKEFVVEIYNKNNWDTEEHLEERFYLVLDEEEREEIGREEVRMYVEDCCLSEKEFLNSLGSGLTDYLVNANDYYYDRARDLIEDDISWMEYDDLVNDLERYNLVSEESLVPVDEDDPTSELVYPKHIIEDAKEELVDARLEEIERNYDSFADWIASEYGVYEIADDVYHDRVEFDVDKYADEIFDEQVDYSLGRYDGHAHWIELDRPYGWFVIYRVN